MFSFAEHVCLVSKIAAMSDIEIEGLNEYSIKIVLRSDKETLYLIRALNVMNNNKIVEELIRSQKRPTKTQSRSVMILYQ